MDGHGHVRLHVHPRPLHTEKNALFTKRPPKSTHTTHDRMGAPSSPRARWCVQSHVDAARRNQTTEPPPLPAPHEALLVGALPNWVHDLWSEMKAEEWAYTSRARAAVAAGPAAPKKRARSSVDDVESALRQCTLDRRRAAPEANDCTTLALWVPPPESATPRRRGCRLASRSRARRTSLADLTRRVSEL